MVMSHFWYTTLKTDPGTCAGTGTVPATCKCGRLEQNTLLAKAEKDMKAKYIQRQKKQKGFVLVVSYHVKHITTNALLTRMTC